MNEFDPVVSILIREVARLPSLVETDKQAHQYLMETQPEYYSILLRLAGEIRSAICDEVGSAEALYRPKDTSYTLAICDCLKIIETRGEGPI